MRLQSPVPKTHNLKELSDLLQQADAGWSAASIDLNRLGIFPESATTVLADWQQRLGRH